MMENVFSVQAVVRHSLLCYKTFKPNFQQEILMENLNKKILVIPYQFAKIFSCQCFPLYSTSVEIYACVCVVSHHGNSVVIVTPLL